MKRIMKIKEWLEAKKTAKLLEDNAAKSPLLLDLAGIVPFDTSPLGRLIYLDYKYSSGERITGELPFED